MISAGHYEGVKKPHEALPEVMGGRKPKLVFDIHSVSDVNEPEVDLSLLPVRQPVKLLMAIQMRMETM